MPNITEINSYVEVQDKSGDVTRILPITKMENVIGYRANLKKEKSALLLLAANSYVIDDITGETYKIGASDGKMYFEKADVTPKEIIETIVVALSGETGDVGEEAPTPSDSDDDIITDDMFEELPEEPSED